MNSRWQASKIGLINFWYYDEQEFPFVKGRMLLRGSNGSGKSVTMQSVVPLLLDGNMSPERLDPFGSRDRKMSSYLLEENDGREERTGYLYLEFKRKDSETYLTVGMGIRARRGKPLDKWYFSLTDGRRIGQDFFLYKETGEKVTLSKRELENRIGDGGRVFERQMDYMEYINRQIFGFETVEEYKEMIDLLIQLRTPKLSKDFKPSVINDILSDSLLPLSDEDLRPMSEAIENMDAMNMNLRSRKEAKQAGEKINTVFSKYNRAVLYEKAEQYEKISSELSTAQKVEKEHRKTQQAYRQDLDALAIHLQKLDAKKASMEKEKESLNKSDAVALKTREAELVREVEHFEKITEEKNIALNQKLDRYKDTEYQVKSETERKQAQEKEIQQTLAEMQSEADLMAFDEHTFMADELMEQLEESYRFETHRQQLESVRQQIEEGTEILAETLHLERQKDEQIRERELQIREMDRMQRKVLEHENQLIQVRSEWKENLHKWNGENCELKLTKDVLRELSIFADSYDDSSDFGKVRSTIADIWIASKMQIDEQAERKIQESKKLSEELLEVTAELEAWEHEKEPEPFRPDAVLRNRERLKQLGIPYEEFYKVIEFGQSLDENACNRLEEALIKMGILDAIVVDSQYRNQVLEPVKGCEDHYLFAGASTSGQSLLDVLEINDDVNDLLANPRIAGVLSSIAYDGDNVVSVAADGTYRVGVLTGTISGEHEAAFLGTKARENHRLSRIAECRLQIESLEKQLQQLEREIQLLEERKEVLGVEYENFPNDVDMRSAFNAMKDAENVCEQLRKKVALVEEKLQQISSVLEEKKKVALELSKRLYLECSYEVFKEAKRTSEEYAKHLVELSSMHRLYRRSAENLQHLKIRLEELDEDMEQIRYDLSHAEREMQRKKEEIYSIQEQLRLTDYEEIRERLDQCISWLNSYPEQLRACFSEKAQKQEALVHLAQAIGEEHEKIQALELKIGYIQQCYEAELNLNYVDLPAELDKDAAHVRSFLESQAKDIDKNSIIADLNRVYFENKGFLNDYHPAQSMLFEDLLPYDLEKTVSGKRLNLTAQYQGVKVSFVSLLNHLEEDIAELENLIRDGDRELFEDILANTVSRKIRSKINASNAWVQKMNTLMNSMNTSSGLKLNLRWRSKTAEQEDQLDTKDLVDLLKKDYRFMAEEEASRLSAHFRSKVEEARRHARDSAGMVSFYQIMKETLDYRKWFEFQLFSQKSGERQKELTNSVFGTFSGGEKAMSMYVPLFSAVVAKYQGGRQDAPRLISLDEAFAGVDNRNIRDMFRLMSEFEFDFIINSQVLWGDCDTLDALAIYQLIRPENAKFVTIMPYLWNGHNKELLENEAQVEQRGAEVGQKSRN